MRSTRSTVRAIRTVTILGRRGPHQIAMTPKELGELGHLEASVPVVDPADFPPLEADEPLDPGLRKSVTILRGFADLAADKPKRMVFDFFAKPVRDRRRWQGRADDRRAHRARREEAPRAAPAKPMRCRQRWSISAIGYSTSPIAGVPFEGGKFVNEGGRIADRLYAVGWARRGPSGTIGTNRPDGYEVADQIAAALPPDSSESREGAEGLKRLLDSRGIMATDYDDWRRIEETEAANARPGSPREKFVRHEDLAEDDSVASLLALSANPHLSSRGLGSRRDPVAPAGSGRGVAQPGRALSSGGRGRRFESSLPDQLTDCPRSRRWLHD